MNSAALKLPRPEEELPEKVSQKIIECEKILGIFSTDSFFAPVWNIYVAASNKSGRIRFYAQSNQIETAILKIMSVDMLAAGNVLSTCSARVRSSEIFFAFLEYENTPIEYITQNTVDRFIAYLENENFENWKRNQAIQTAACIVDVCNALDILRIPQLLDMSRRWADPKAPRRAPDKIIVEQLDKIYFDLNKPIPVAYRALYLTARLRTHRISEVLSMPLECIGYPSEGVFSVFVSTSKESSYHVPIFHTYNFLLNGRCESIYFQALMEQYEYAASVQDQIDEQYKGYLYVHPFVPRLVTAVDFNENLAENCKTYKVVDSSGNPAVIASHALRHINVCERLQSNIMFPEDVMVECNHTSLEMTLGYGYPSRHDETKHLARITEKVFDFSGEKPVQPVEMPQYKYLCLEESTAARLLPGYGLCLNHKCVPRFEKCFCCESFRPSAIYKDYILATIERLRKKNETLTKKKGSREAIEHNKRQIQLFCGYIEKLEFNTLENQNHYEKQAE